MDVVPMTLRSQPTAFLPIFYESVTKMAMRLRFSER